MDNNQTNLLPLEKINFPVKVILSDKVAKKINIYHRKFKGTEWSGFIAYSIQSKIKDENKRKKELLTKGGTLKVEDIIFLDLGEPAYTSFDLGDFNELPKELQDYMLSGYHIGLIHTHHGMNTFFSGTDEKELRENTPNNLFYLSVIVNYQTGGNPIARLCYNAEIKEKKEIILPFFSIKTKSTEEVKSKIIYTDCNVVYEGEEEELKTIEERLESKRKTITLFNYNARTSNGTARIGETRPKPKIVKSTEIKILRIFGNLLNKDYLSNISPGVLSPLPLNAHSIAKQLKTGKGLDEQLEKFSEITKDISFEELHEFQEYIYELSFLQHGAKKHNLIKIAQFIEEFLDNFIEIDEENMETYFEDIPDSALSVLFYILSGGKTPPSSITNAMDFFISLPDVTYDEVKETLSTLPSVDIALMKETLDLLLELVDMEDDHNLSNEIIMNYTPYTSKLIEFYNEIHDNTNTTKKIIHGLF